MNSTYTVTANNAARHTTTGVENGVDVEFSFAGYGLSIEGEVTLIPDRNGDWASWGAPSNWLSSEALEQLLALADNDFRAALNAIEAATAREAWRTDLGD